MSMHDDIEKVLVSEEQLKAKVAELGAQISKDYEGKNLVLVSILKGSVVFMADLMRAVSIPCSIDFMVVTFATGTQSVSFPSTGYEGFDVEVLRAKSSEATTINLWIDANIKELGSYKIQPGRKVL